MSRKYGLERIRGWPQWAVIPLGLGLAGLTIILGLLLEQAANALTPVSLEPTPTLPTIAYSGALADGCHDCHFSLTALQASAADPSNAKAFLIEPESVVTPHGKLGCIACHGGENEAEDKIAAHEGLVADMSAQEPEKCLICHHDLPGEIPGDRLRVPHGTIVARIEVGNPCDAHCSDCHGGVGHGFDPLSGEKFCSMTVCLDCHQEKELEVQMADCGACHLGPHDIVAFSSCSHCHSSAATWEEIDRGAHPVPLPGKHSEVGCFDCHQYPNFAGLNNTCTDCHMPSHADWGDGDCAECHDAGATWDVVAEAWEGHVGQWDQYKGEHLNVSCRGCHFETYGGLDPSCTSCHMTPASHDDGRSGTECETCHQADQPWGG